jgi:hypothetical protein
MPTTDSPDAGGNPDPYDERFDHLFEGHQHDYDPRWDYELRADQFDDPLLAIARERMDGLAAREDTPFEHGHVFPARLDEQHTPSGHDLAGVYCAGTYIEPIILIDLDSHRELESKQDILREIIQTVDHEVAHAIHEHADPEGSWADEDAAESHCFD